MLKCAGLSLEPSCRRHLTGVVRVPVSIPYGMLTHQWATVATSVVFVALYI